MPRVAGYLVTSDINGRAFFSPCCLCSLKEEGFYFFSFPFNTSVLAIVKHRTSICSTILLSFFFPSPLSLLELLMVMAKAMKGLLVPWRNGGGWCFRGGGMERGYHLWPLMLAGMLVSEDGADYVSFVAARGGMDAQSSCLWQPAGKGSAQASARRERTATMVWRCGHEGW